MRISTRKWLTGVFTAVAGLLAVASLAAACTTWKGKLTVTGNGSTPGSVDATGKRTSIMKWCNGPNGTANVVANTSGTVTVTVSPGSCLTPNTLGADTYDIRWTTGVWDPTANNGAGGGSDCMNTSDPDIGDVVVDSTGNSSATTSGSFNPGGTGSISVCVVKGTIGNQVPLSVI